MHRWIHGWMDGWMDEGKEGREVERGGGECEIWGRRHVCMNVWMYECTYVWTYGCMDVWMYGCIDACILSSRKALKINTLAINQTMIVVICT